MSSITSCPNCSARVTLPDAGEDAWVRCPLCGSEYPLRQALEHQPPALELIEAPSARSARNVPTWDAVAAPAATDEPLVAATEFGATANDSGIAERSDVIAMSAGGPFGEPIVAATPGGSDVITFDDSLLMDETTDEIPLEQPPASEGARIGSAAAAINDDDFFHVVSEEPSEKSGEESGEAIEWGGGDIVEPYKVNEDRAATADEEFRLAPHVEADATLARAAAEQIGAPVIGLPPRRGRRGSPIIMVGGIIGGGVLGLAIGYAILMWAFKTDPLALAPKLPEFMVPAALRAQPKPTIPRDASGSDPAVDSFAKSGDAFPAIGEVKTPTDKSGDDAMPDNGAAKQSGDYGTDRAEPGTPAKSNPLADSTSTDATNSDSPKSDPFSAGAARTKDGPSAKEKNALDLDIGPLAPSKGETKSPQPAGKESIKDPLADPFGDAAKSRPVTNTSDSTSAKNDAGKPAPEPKIDPLADPFAEPGETTTKEVAPAAAESLGPTSDKTYSEAELLAAIDAAKATTRAALTMDPGADLKQKKSVAGAYYRDLSKVAEAFTFSEASKGGQEQKKTATAAIEAMLDAAPDSNRLNELGKLAGYWFANPQGKGIILSGIVKSSKERGMLVESVVETLGKPTTITVVSPSALTDDPSRPVLVAGAIVNDPAENLRGYEGAATRVVWAAVAIDPMGGTSARSRSADRPATTDPPGSAAGKDSSADAADDQK